MPTFHLDCTRWCIYIYYSIIIFGKKPMPLKGKLHHPHDYITNIISPHMTEGVTGTSLSAGLQHETSVARDHLCQITSNWKLSHKCKERYEFSSRNKVKSHHKRPACTTTTTITTTTTNTNTTTFVFCKSETKMTNKKYVHFQKSIS